MPGRLRLRCPLVATLKFSTRPHTNLAQAVAEEKGRSTGATWSFTRKKVWNFIPERKRWELFFERPQEWWDQRHCKPHSLSADFVHRTRYYKLYLPDESGKRKEPVPDLADKLALLEQAPDAARPARLPSQDEGWQDLFDRPWRFKDVRGSKSTDNSPDFKHRDLGFGLWLNSAPEWVMEHRHALELAFVAGRPRMQVLTLNSGEEGEAVAEPERDESKPKQELLWDAEQQKKGIDVLMSSLDHDVTKEAVPPKAVFSHKLMRHQQRGLAWMLQREAEGEGPHFGMLCDEQGLGKTAQAMALIASNPCQFNHKPSDEAEALEEQSAVCERLLSNSLASSSLPAELLQSAPAGNFQAEDGSPDGAVKATLVVLQKTLIKQWSRELAEWTKLKVAVYDAATKDKMTRDLLAGYDVVLTTYQSVLYASPLKTSQPRLLFNVQWWRIILDEAQAIKEHRGKTSAAVALLQVQEQGSRWIMTGTPMQNSPQDLYAYFHFLRYDPFDEPAAFQRIFKEGDSPIINARLQAIVRPVMLRRTKSSRIDGTLILDLPPRKTTLQAVSPSEEEQAIYKNIEARMQESFQEKADGETHARRSAALALVMQLRRACNHPWLASSYAAGLEAAYEESGAEGPGGSRSEPQGSLLRSAKLQAVLDFLRENTDTEKVIVFSQWTATLDLLEVLIGMEGWEFCRLDGSLTGDKRDAAVQEFKGNDDIRILLVSLGAGKEGLNLAEATRVILVEPHFNPMNEEQAIDRAHRFGQKKPVHAHKLYVKGTIEERILELQQYKVQVSSAIIQETDSDGAPSDGPRLLGRRGFTLQDLQYLLGVKQSNQDGHAPPSVAVQSRPSLLT